MKDRRILNEDGLLVFPEREPRPPSKRKPYSCYYHNPPIAGVLKGLIKEHNKRGGMDYGECP